MQVLLELQRTTGCFYRVSKRPERTACEATDYELDGWSSIPSKIRNPSLLYHKGRPWVLTERASEYP
jgi:hypothetical protein